MKLCMELEFGPALGITDNGMYTSGELSSKARL